MVPTENMVVMATRRGPSSNFGFKTSLSYIFLGKVTVSIKILGRFWVMLKKPRGGGGGAVFSLIHKTDLY